MIQDRNTTNAIHIGTQRTQINRGTAVKHKSKAGTVDKAKETARKGDIIDISSSAQTEETQQVEEQQEESKTSKSRTERHNEKLENSYGEPKADRARTSGGQFVRKHSNTKLATLEETYGKIVPEGWDRNMTLKQLLDKTGQPSLTQLLKHRKELSSDTSQANVPTQASAGNEPPVIPPAGGDVTPPAPPPPPPPPPENLVLDFLQDRALWRDGYRHGYDGVTGNAFSGPHIHHPQSPSWLIGNGMGSQDGTNVPNLYLPGLPGGGVYYPGPHNVNPSGNFQHNHHVENEPVKVKSFVMDPPLGEPVKTFRDKDGNLVKAYNMEDGSKFYDLFGANNKREQKIVDRDGDLRRQVTTDTEGNEVCTTIAKDHSSKMETSDGKVIISDSEGNIVKSYTEAPKNEPAGFWQNVPENAKLINPDKHVAKNLMDSDKIVSYELPNGDKFSEVLTGDGKEHQILTDKKGNYKNMISRDPSTGEEIKFNYNPDGSVLAENNNGSRMFKDRNGNTGMYDNNGRCVTGNGYETPYFQPPQKEGFGSKFLRSLGTGLGFGAGAAGMGLAFGLPLMSSMMFNPLSMMMNPMSMMMNPMSMMMNPMSMMMNPMSMMMNPMNMMFGGGNMLTHGLMSSGLGVMSSLFSPSAGMMNLAFPGASLVGAMGTTGFGLW